MLPLGVPVSVRRPAVLHTTVPLTRRDQPCVGAEFVDGSARGGERRRIRLIVVDHAHPTAVGPAHQVQWPPVHGYVPRAPTVLPGPPGVVPDTCDAAPAVRLHETLPFAGRSRPLPHRSRRLRGRPRRHQYRCKSHRERRCEQPPQHPASYGGPGGVCGRLRRVRGAGGHGGDRRGRRGARWLWLQWLTGSQCLPLPRPEQGGPMTHARRATRMRDAIGPGFLSPLRPRSGMLADRGHVSGVYGAPGLRRFESISRSGGAGHIVFLSKQLGATGGNCFTTVNEPSSERKLGTQKITTPHTEGHPNEGHVVSAFLRPCSAPGGSGAEPRHHPPLGGVAGITPQTRDGPASSVSCGLTRTTGCG